MTYKSQNYNDMDNLFDNDDLQNIHRIAKKTSDAFPDMVEEFEDDSDEFVVEVKTVKKAFEVLSEEELEELGIDSEVVEELIEKMDLIEEDVSDEVPEDFADIEELRGHCEHIEEE